MVLLLFDVSSLMYRAHHSLDPTKFKRADGLATNVVYGVASMVIKRIQDEQKLHKTVFPVACMDSPTCNSRRKQVLPSYKQTRNKCPSTMSHQFEWVNDLFDALGIKCVSVPNYEADDIIASYSKQCKDQYDAIVIVSPDKDMNQLIDEKIQVYNTFKKQYLDKLFVKNTFGVYPSEFILYQALLGDKVDNIPGIRSVGPKTAASITTAVSGDIANINRTDFSKRGLVIENMEIVLRNIKLVTLSVDVEVDHIVRHFCFDEVKGNNKLKDFLKTMDITSTNFTKYV